MCAPVQGTELVIRIKGLYMEKKKDDNPAEHSGLGENDKMSNRRHGKDPATTNNQPFDEGQLEKENKPPEPEQTDEDACDEKAGH